ncbi:MAG: mitomycin resistance protein [Deltaproteobacteria bacterium]|nr:mitomycin resistance protein [Deltaproteobacteria bacterium]
MHPSKVDRSRLRELTDLPNIGPAMAGDLRLLGITRPDQLVGRDPFVMYEALCAATNARHDPCVIDVFISIVRFMNGEPPRPWWDYTTERKKALARGGPEARARA